MIIRRFVNIYFSFADASRLYYFLFNALVRLLIVNFSPRSSDRRCVGFFFPFQSVYDLLRYQIFMRTVSAQ